MSHAGKHKHPKLAGKHERESTVAVHDLSILSEFALEKEGATKQWGKREHWKAIKVGGEGRHFIRLKTQTRNSQGGSEAAITHPRRVYAVQNY